MTILKVKDRTRCILDNGILCVRDERNNRILQRTGIFGSGRGSQGVELGDGGESSLEHGLAVPLHQLTLGEGRERAVLGDGALEDNLVQPIQGLGAVEGSALEGLGLHNGEFAVGGAVHQLEGSSAILDGDVLTHNGLHVILLAGKVCILGSDEGIGHGERALEGAFVDGLRGGVTAGGVTAGGVATRSLLGMHAEEESTVAGIGIGYGFHFHGGLHGQSAAQRYGVMVGICNRHGIRRGICRAIVSGHIHLLDSLANGELERSIFPLPANGKEFNLYGTGRKNNGAITIGRTLTVLDMLDIFVSGSVISNGELTIIVSVGAGNHGNIGFHDAHFVSARTGSRRNLAAGIHAVQIGSALSGGLCRGVVLGKRSVDDNLVANLHVGIFRRIEGGVVQVVNLVCFELLFLVLGAVVGDEEGSLMVAVVGEVLVCVVFLIETLDLTLHIVLGVTGIVVAFDVCHDPGIGLGGGESGLEGEAVVGDGRSAAGHAHQPAGLAGELRGIAAIVDQFTGHHHFFTYFYLIVAFHPHLVCSMIVDTVAGKLRAGSLTVFGDVEGSGAVLGTEGVLDGRDNTLDVYHVFGHFVGFQCRSGIIGSLGVVRIGLGAGSLGRFIAALTAAAAFSVDGVDVTAGGLRGVALEVHDFGADDDFVVLGKFLAAESPLLVVEVEDTVGREHSIVAFVHHGERSVAVLGGKLFGDALDLTLDVIGIGCGGFAHFLSLGNSGSHIEGIVERTGTLGFAGVAGAGVYTATVHAIEAVDEGCALAHGLGGITFIIIDCTVDDDFVLFLDVGVAVSLGPLHIAQIVGLEHLEDLGGTFFVNNVEGSVAVGAAGLVGGLHRGDDTLHKDLLGALDIGPQSLHVLDGAGHGERIVQGTVSVVYHTLRAHLADGEGLTGKADGEDDGGAAVVALVLGDRDGELLTVGIGGAGLLGEGDPVRKAGYGPVAGGDKADILGGDLGLKAYVRGIHGELGGTQVHFFLVTGHEHGCSGQDCQKEFSKFHIQLLLCF